MAVGLFLIGGAEIHQFWQLSKEVTRAQNTPSQRGEGIMRNTYSKMLILLFLLAPTVSKGADGLIDTLPLANLADDLNTCGAYNTIVTHCIKNRNKPSDADALAQQAIVEKFFLTQQIEIATMIGLSAKAFRAKRDMAQQSMTAEIENCVNLAILIQKHGAACQDLQRDFYKIATERLEKSGVK
jgi:hypothetical protein